MIQNYLLSLHTLIPFLRNYEDIPINVQNVESKILRKAQRDCRTNLTEYDEIEMVQGAKLKSQNGGLAKETETTNNREDEQTNTGMVQERDSVYSLQRTVLSTNLWKPHNGVTIYYFKDRSWTIAIALVIELKYFVSYNHVL